MVAQNWARVGDLAVVRGELNIPAVGAWVLDCDLDSVTAPSGGVTLTWGNLTLAGTVFRGSAYVGRARVLVVGGAAGWSSPIGPLSYNLPGGVMASLVVSDAARAVGETCVVDSDAPLGTYWSAVGDKASRVLRKVALALTGGAWYVDNSGVTHVGARPSAAIKSPFTSQEFFGGSGDYVEISTEDPTSWLPGNTFDDSTLPGPFTLSSVRQVVDEHGVLKVWGMIA